MLIHKGNTGIPWVPKGPLRISDHVILLDPGVKTKQHNTKQSPGLRRPDQLLGELLSPEGKTFNSPPQPPQLGLEKSKET